MCQWRSARSASTRTQGTTGWSSDSLHHTEPQKSADTESYLTEVARVPGERQHHRAFQEVARANVSCPALQSLKSEPELLKPEMNRAMPPDAAPQREHEHENRAPGLPDPHALCFPYATPQLGSWRPHSTLRYVRSVAYVTPRVLAQIRVEKSEMECYAVRVLEIF